MRAWMFTLLFICITNYIYAIDGLLIKTIDYSLRDKWSNTLGATTPKITSADTVFKKQNIFITAVAWDYAPGNNDSANVQFSLQIFKPDNSLYASTENLALLRRQMAGNHNLQMSDSIITVSFDDDAPFGKYTIELTLSDKMSGKEKKIRGVITLVPLPGGDSHLVKDKDDFMAWFNGYYENPHPEEALSYYVFFANSDIAGDANSFWGPFSIFLEIGKHNPFLSTQIINFYKTQDLKTKISLLYWLVYSALGTSEFFDSLRGDEKATWLKLKDMQVDVYADISDGFQLDMLWGTFMASGSYKPVLKLIKTLDYVKYKGSLDNYKKSAKTEEDRRKAMDEAVYQATVWSMKSNYSQYELIREYCNWAYQYEDLSPVQKQELKKIMTQ